MGGLQKTLFLCKNAKVHLTKNYEIEWGLFNGAVGTVVDILYDNNRPTAEDLPRVVFVDFQKYSGPPFLMDHPTIVPLIPTKQLTDCKCCTRVQLPLRLGWGTTIHSCQGLTIGSSEPNRHIIINPGTRQFESLNPGALYVCVSRAKTAGNDEIPPDFAWNKNILVTEDRLCHQVNSYSKKARDREIIRLNKLAQITTKTKCNLHSKKVFEKLKKIINKIKIHVDIEQ